jgi:hypothetical protein
VAAAPRRLLPVGSLVAADGATLAPPGPDEIVIDQWVADDLAAQGRPVIAGDTLDVAYFLPETIHGRIEEARVRLRVSGIAAMRQNRSYVFFRELTGEAAGSALVTSQVRVVRLICPAPMTR